MKQFLIIIIFFFANGVYGQHGDKKVMAGQDITAKNVFGKLHGGNVTGLEEYFDSNAFLNTKELIESLEVIASEIKKVKENTEFHFLITYPNHQNVYHCYYNDEKSDAHLAIFLHFKQGEPNSKIIDISFKKREQLLQEKKKRIKSIDDLPPPPPPKR